MRKILICSGFAAVLLVSCGPPLWAQNTDRPAEVASATDIPYPIRSVADGIVIFDVSINSQGALAGLEVIRDVPSLTPAATSSVSSWRFTPALMQGTPVPSRIRVAVVFRPRSYFASGPNFTPIRSNGVGGTGGGLPGIVSVVYPQYPVNAVNPATVVIQVAVGGTGGVRTKVVRDVPPFSKLSLGALGSWRFQPAMVDGKPTPSNLAIAFVFAPLSE
jgi:Gram-negative bacterial TonB protein C-terminal